MALETDRGREPAHAFSAGGCSVAVWPIDTREEASSAQGEDRHHLPGVPGRPSGTDGSDPGHGAAGRPFVYLHVYDGDGADVAEALEGIGCVPCTLVAVKPACWNDDMTPWECPGLFAGDAPFAGHAECQLHLLEREIIPRAEALVRAPVAASAKLTAEALAQTRPANPSPIALADPGDPDAPDGARPSFTGPADPDGTRPQRIIAGYSLAGLFAIWAQARSAAFDRVASASGSLWYPGFARFVRESAMTRPPECAFVSLGKKETKTPSRLLRNVAQGTDEVVAALREKGIPTRFVLNPGNHFKEPALRMARGIAWCASWPDVAREDGVPASPTQADVLGDAREPADNAPRP